MNRSFSTVSLPTWGGILAADVNRPAVRSGGPHLAEPPEPIYKD